MTNTGGKNMAEEYRPGKNMNLRLSGEKANDKREKS
jgi:hypothetical protein